MTDSWLNEETICIYGEDIVIDEDLVKRLNEKILADAFEKRSIVDGSLCERLIYERKEAAGEIIRLREENVKLRSAFRVNMLRAFSNMSHEEIDAEINRVLETKDEN